MGVMGDNYVVARWLFTGLLGEKSARALLQYAVSNVCGGFFHTKIFPSIN